MKDMLKKVAVLLAAVALTLGAWAATWHDSTTGYTWSYSVMDGKAEIGTGVSWMCAVSPEPSGALTIPATLDGYSVVSIGMYAFYECSGLQSVTIPSSVIRFGNGIFGGTAA